MSILNIIKGVVSNMSQPGSQQVYSQTAVLVAGTPQILDFKSLVNTMKVDNIQGVYVDNSAGGAAVNISVAATLQNFTVPQGYQGICPLFVTQDMVLILSGNGNIPMVFLNFPTPAAVWPASGATSGSMTFTGPNLNTQDVTLAASADQGSVGVVEKNYTTLDGLIRRRLGRVASANLTAAATTVILAGAPSVFLSSVDVSVDGNASLAAAGPFTVTLFFGTSAVRIFQRTIVLPAAAPAVATPRYELFNQSDLAFLGTLAADNISITLSAALTTGTVSYVLGLGQTGVQ